jgi:hypothetical protein
MALFVVVVAVICLTLGAGLWSAFQANPVFNGVIVALTLIGIGYTVRSVWVLGPEIEWLEATQDRLSGVTHGPQVVPPEPSLLAPMARMIGERRGGGLSMSALSLRSVLDSIGARLGETREISRYSIGLLVFLGLLGTFWGLLRTIGSVGDVIGGLSVETADLDIVFGELKSGLEAPLGGMGTAFSSSLFGLGGSLVLGFLELQASQAQNRFYNELEDWLSGTARLVGGAEPGEAAGGEGPARTPPAFLMALVQRTAENLDQVQRLMATAETDRRRLNEDMRGLADKLTTLNDHMRTQQSVMVRVAEAQLDLKPVLQRLAEAADADAFGLDEATRHHVRSMAEQLNRLGPEMADYGRDAVDEIRGEIRLLAQTIAQLAGEEEE